MSSEVQGVSPDTVIQPQIDAFPQSPIQEQHIDFLLEEEFACNTNFLSFFLVEAAKHFVPPQDSTGEALIPSPSAEWNCKAVRSVTTSAGESDVLVVYASADQAHPRVAILIEDKVRAGFQENQAERYRTRGNEGREKGTWHRFFTCLVSPEKYTKDNAGFDTRVSLERLQSFFSATDDRTRFKAGVLERALAVSASSGLQKIDAVMTAFRYFYAAQAEAALSSSKIHWEVGRDAWYDDTWFNFGTENLVKGSKIVYKPRLGSVELSYPHCNASDLNAVLADCSSREGISTKQTGKSAAFYTSIEPIAHFSEPTATLPMVEQSFNAVRRLIAFHAANHDLLHAKMGA